MKRKLEHIYLIPEDYEFTNGITGPDGIDIAIATDKVKYEKGKITVVHFLFTDEKPTAYRMNRVSDTSPFIYCECAYIDEDGNDLEY